MSDQALGRPCQRMLGQPPQDGYPQGPGGPQYPYNSPPQEEQRHWVRNIFLGILGLVVISVDTSCGSGVSTTPSGNGGTPQANGSPSATRASAPAGPGAYFDVKDESGDTYRVKFDKIIDPAQGSDQFTTPNHGMRFVGVVFTIKAISGSPKDEDANNDAAVVGSNGQTYTPDIDSIAGYTNFSNGQINVAQGDSTKGAVAFQVPTGAMLETCGWPGWGCTFPVTVSSLKQMTGVGAPAGKVQPDAHRSPWRWFRS